MLSEYRRIVRHMWDVVDILDEKGIGKMIPHLSESGNLRHVIKGEVIYDLFVVFGLEKEPNDEQVEFLQEVLHASITKENRAAYTKKIREMDHVRFSPLMPYIVIMDMKCKTNLSKIYLDFIGAIITGYLESAEMVELNMIARYYSLMTRNKTIIERGLQRTIDFDPLRRIL